MRARGAIGHHTCSAGHIDASRNCIVLKTNGTQLTRCLRRATAINHEVVSICPSCCWVCLSIHIHGNSAGAIRSQIASLQATTIDGCSPCVGVRHVKHQTVAIVFYDRQWRATIEVYHLEPDLIVGSGEVAGGCTIGDGESAAR